VLLDRIQKNREGILSAWREVIAATYPVEKKLSIGQEKDRFANPVGHVIQQGTEAVLEGICQALDSSQRLGPLRENHALCIAIDGVVRVRAVQDFSAAESVSFFLTLKDIIRKTLPKESLSSETVRQDLMRMDHIIDEILLMAFDIYMQCREKIYEIKANEIKARTFKLLERLNVTKGTIQ